MELDGVVVIPMTVSAVLWSVGGVLTLDLIYSFSAVRFDMQT